MASVRQPLQCGLERRFTSGPLLRQPHPFALARFLLPHRPLYPPFQLLQHGFLCGPLPFRAPAATDSARRPLSSVPPPADPPRWHSVPPAAVEWGGQFEPAAPSGPAPLPVQAEYRGPGSDWSPPTPVCAAPLPS